MQIKYLIGGTYVTQIQVWCSNSKIEDKLTSHWNPLSNIEHYRLQTYSQLVESQRVLEFNKWYITLGKHRSIFHQRGNVGQHYYGNILKINYSILQDGLTDAVFLLQFSVTILFLLQFMCFLFWFVTWIHFCLIDLLLLNSLNYCCFIYSA